MGERRFRDGAVTRKKNRRKKPLDKLQTEAIEPDSAKLGVWISTLICMVSFLVHLHTISFKFVRDDETQILRNPWIRDWSKVVQFFTTDVWAFSRIRSLTNYYRPFHMVAHALGYSLTGFQPEGYHLINILLHVVSSLLVARIALQLTQEKSVALLAGLLFALHPMHSESVSWIAVVTDPLCAVFYFGALALYLRNSSSPGNIKTIAALLLLFLGALFSKEMAFVFPLVAVWSDWCLKRELRWSRYALLMGAFAIYGVFRISALGFRPGVSNLSLEERFLSSIVLLASYVVRVFVPYGINPCHVFHPTRSLLDVRFLFATAALALVVFFAWWQRKNRAVLFLTGFLGISLLPLMNIGDIGQERVSADRYLYIPSLASCILIPLLAQSAWRRRARTVSFLDRHAVYLLVSPVLLVFGVLLVQSSLLWRDPPTLYARTLERAPDSPTFTGLLAAYYFQENDYAKAEPLFFKVIDLCQNGAVAKCASLSDAYNGLGGILYSRHRYVEAKQFCEKAHALSPNDYGTLQNLGSVNFALGNYPEALKYFRAAVVANPRNEYGYYNLATFYLMLGQYEPAIENAKRALEIYPNLSEAYISMGRAYAGLGMKEKAREAYQESVRMDPAQISAVAAALKELAN